MRYLLPCLFLFLIAQPLLAQPRKEPLVDRVKSGITRGVEYLRTQQRNNGSWEVTDAPLNYEGGTTSLVILSLLNAGVPKNDPAITNALNFLRKLESTKTYVRALQTLALAEAAFPQDRELLQKNVQWLIDAQVLRGGRVVGWTYEQRPKTGFTDASNSQYALLGLWAGKQAGIDIKREVWEGIRDYYLRTQGDDGSFIYSKEDGFTGHDRPSMTMTTAGLCGLLIAGMELNDRRETLQADGTATNCGVYAENLPTANALRWIGKHFAPSLDQRTFYHLYGIERAGRLSGLRFFGEHDWYREGCDFLVGAQNKGDGSWRIEGVWDRWPVVSTSFALLFLSKGRTPVLVSKLVHGAWPRRPDDLDWNNDRHDLRNLVNFINQGDLFKKTPMAWQTFDLRWAVNAHSKEGAALSDEQQATITSELLQSPIAYISGHQSPQFRFQEVEKGLLKRFIENGGLIMAEACCGNPAFDKGFKLLIEDLWPGYELKYLESTHPVWTSHYQLKPGDPYKLMGLSLSCGKTAVIYSPQDLSCAWESNQANEGRTQAAFRLGANIVAYATGLEPPRPRLTPVEVTSSTVQTSTRKRGFFQVGQIHHGSEWQPAPRAMTNLMEHVNKQFGLDVQFRTEKINLGDPDAVHSKFLYMHGRTEFRIGAEQAEKLRFNLENGGLLLADACCGKEPFDQSFRRFATELFPKEKLQQVPVNDVLFSAELNREALTLSNIKARRAVNGPMQSLDPWLEGIKINNRWVLLYSKYDLGCALERHQASDCIGYSTESAQRLAAAAVLYQLRP
jgi:hypothetical protein